MPTLAEHPATVATVPEQDKHPLRFGTLTAADRCDAAAPKQLQEVTGVIECATQAFVRVVVTETQHLLFCVRCFRKHAAKIADVGYEVIDESDRINDKPTDPDSSPGF